MNQHARSNAIAEIGNKYCHHVLESIVHEE
jgi:hypothetical protein